MALENAEVYIEMKIKERYQRGEMGSLERQWGYHISLQRSLLLTLGDQRERTKKP